MKKDLSSQKVTCIIPFYNEDGNNVYKTIKKVLKIPEIDYVIVIDDGSLNVSTFNILKNAFQKRKNGGDKITFFRSQINYGKSNAVHLACNLVSTEIVFLLDSDLKKIDEEEISNAIDKFKLLDLDMLILRRVNTGFLPKLIRADTLLSGERILKKKHLVEVLNTNVKGYELEVTLNQYMIIKGLDKNCYWSPSSAVNNYKYKKIKFIKGIFKDIKMYVNIIKHIGLREFINQISFFCKKNI
jgi:glycosyltransferase involved in cell wall biosynthesis